MLSNYKEALNNYKVSTTLLNSSNIYNNPTICKLNPVEHFWFSSHFLKYYCMLEKTSYSKAFEQYSKCIYLEELIMCHVCVVLKGFLICVFVCLPGEAEWGTVSAGAQSRAHWGTGQNYCAKSKKKIIDFFCLGCKHSEQYQVFIVCN